MKKPNGYYYWIAKEFLRQAYSKTTANSFYGFTLTFKGNYANVECFNGGAFVSIKIYETHISMHGQYSKHKRVNKGLILTTANDMLIHGNLPAYYSVKFQENITTNSRCVIDIEKAKKDVVKFWNMCHTTSMIQEPINWIITEV